MLFKGKNMAHTLIPMMYRDRTKFVSTLIGIDENAYECMKITQIQNKIYLNNNRCI